MALQSSGTITIQDIADEFGGIAPHSLSEYYRNGIYVGSSNTGVPTSGTISLSDFYGASAATVVTVTEGTVAIAGADTFGYADTNKVPNYNTPPDSFFTSAAFGARSPGALNGVTIQGIMATEITKISPARFHVVLSGARAKSFFTSVLPLGGTTLNTASATYFTQFSGSTIWSWNTSVPSGWDGTGTRTATFA